MNIVHIDKADWLKFLKDDVPDKHKNDIVKDTRYYLESFDASKKKYPYMPQWLKDAYDVNIESYEKIHNDNLKILDDIISNGIRNFHSDFYCPVELIKVDERIISFHNLNNKLSPFPKYMRGVKIESCKSAQYGRKITDSLMNNASLEYYSSDKYGRFMKSDELKITHISTSQLEKHDNVKEMLPTIVENARNFSEYYYYPFINKNGR